MAIIHHAVRGVLGLAAAFALITVDAEAQEIVGMNAIQPEHITSGVGSVIQIGGGPIGVVEDTVRQEPLGGTWSLRGIVGTRSFIAGELAYVGHARDFDRAGLTNDAMLLNNGGELEARLNLPIGFGMENRTLLEPYAHGGVGYMVRSVGQDDIIDPTADTADDYFTFPVGAGVMLGYAGAVLDTRVTYRPTTDGAFIDNDFVDPASPPNELAWTTSVGIEF